LNDVTHRQPNQHLHCCACQCCCSNAEALANASSQYQSSLQYFHPNQSGFQNCCSGTAWGTSKKCELQLPQTAYQYEDYYSANCRVPEEIDDFNFIEDKPLGQKDDRRHRVEKSRGNSAASTENCKKRVETKHEILCSEAGKPVYDARKCQGVKWSSATCDHFGIVEQGWKCTRCCNLSTITDDVTQLVSAAPKLIEVKSEGSEYKRNTENGQKGRLAKSKSPDRAVVKETCEVIKRNENLKEKMPSNEMLLLDLTVRESASESAKKNERHRQVKKLVVHSTPDETAIIKCNTKKPHGGDAEKPELYLKLSGFDSSSQDDTINGTWESSMVFQHCAFPKCINFASKHTKPFCHEHSPTEGEEKTVTPALALFNLALLGGLCQMTASSGMTSPTAQPYSDEHRSDIIKRSNQRHSDVTACWQRANQQDASTMTDAMPPAPSQLSADPVTAPNDYTPSLVPIQCIHPSCTNYVSVFTRPVCYEHLGYNTCLPSAPPCYDDLASLEMDSSSSLPSLIGRGSTTMTRKNFMFVMEDLEKRKNGPVTKCITPACSNNGNAKCRGRCNECSKQTRH
jgi:hypothetical protein